MDVSALYRDFHQALYGYIKSKVSNTEDAEDILQNVFVKITSNIDKLSSTEKLKSWIYAIARNAIIDFYRANSNKKKADLNEELAEETPEDESFDPTKGLDKCLAGFIAQLPGDYRDIIVDVELKGIKQKDLVQKYDLAYPSVRSRVQRGRERLRQMLLSCCRIKWDTRGNILDAESSSCNPNDPCNNCNN